MILTTDLTGWEIGFDVFISLLFGAGGALGVWFKLKNVVNIHRVEIDNLNTSVISICDAKKSHRIKGRYAKNGIANYYGNSRNKKIKL